MPKTFLKSCKVWILDILFPNRCPFCNEIIRWDKSVCEDCEHGLDIACEQICHKCGNYNCSCNDDNCYDNAFAALFFDDEKVSNAVYDFKRTGMSNLAEYTSEIVGKYLEKADLVVGVPMGKRKKRNRGHNQAEILAKCIGERLDTAVGKNILYKIDTKEEQHHFSEEERKERVKSLFYGSDTDLSGKTIILCDDVMTTGATINRCAELLKEMGAKKVIVCVCAVTKLYKSQREG
ncbi:MAG: ComF family protein [Oscillospiraceae bacterium]|nr:ComF family protein [Oscillospiraceae bacterium]